MQPKNYHSAIAKLNALDEVVEAYYTTGAYNIFVKLMCKSIEEAAVRTDR